MVVSLLGSPLLPLISLPKWSVLIYQSPLQTWTRRYSIIERTGHGDLDVSNGLISSFRGPSSLRGSHRKGKREAGGNKGKEEVQDFLWTLLIVLSPYKMIPFLILTGTKSPTQSTHGHEIKSSTSGGKVSSAQTRASQKHSTGNNAPQRKTENEEEESNSVKRIALFAVTAILAGGLLLCILVLLFLFIWRRHLR